MAIPRPKWLRPPLLPLVYLLLVALPLSIWQSPGADRLATATFVAQVALLVLAAATAFSHRRSATLLWARIYFALGAILAWSHARFDANELAGIMLLFVPLAATLALARPLPPIHRLQAGLLALLFGSTLLAAGSRGGILVLAVTAGVLLALERRWRPLCLGLLGAAALAAAGGIDWLIYDGKVQGLTLESLLTGRPEIWRRSLHAIADFTWTGIGFGTFGQVVPALYYPPGTRNLDHAHSLVLQTALDLGAGGFLAVAAIVWVAFRRVLCAHRRTPHDKPRSAWALGLFGSLLAFTLFNLADAIPLGTPGTLPLFLLLGLIYALPAPYAPGRQSWRIPARPRWRLLLGVLFVVFGLPSIRAARQLGTAAVAGARAILHAPEEIPAAHASLKAIRRGTCRAGWLEGKVAQAWGRPDLRDAAWSDLLRCQAAFVPMIEAELPEHYRLAELALEAQPESPGAHFWLARVRARSGDPNAIDLYRRGLDLEPDNGLAWFELGRLLAAEDPRAAFDAFAQSCRRGDPGANACRAAGQAAERLGDLDAAIRYYRRSRLPSARARADELERERRSEESS